MRHLALAITTPAAVALLVGVSALLTSPSTCACLSSAQVVARTAGFNPSWAEAANLSGAKIENGLQQNLVGRTLDERWLFPSSTFGCTTPTADTVECFVETSKSWALSKGWLVRLTHDPQGAITKASVTDTWRAAP